MNFGKSAVYDRVSWLYCIIVWVQICTTGRLIDIPLDCKVYRTSELVEGLLQTRTVEEFKSDEEHIGFQRILS